MSEPLDLDALRTLRAPKLVSLRAQCHNPDYLRITVATPLLRDLFAAVDAAAEERDDLRQYLINAESKLERLRSRDRILSEIEKMPGRSSLYHHADGSWSLRTYETENGEGYKWRTIAKGTLTDVTEARRRAALDDKEDAQ